jgi:hypothetical protein
MYKTWWQFYVQYRSAALHVKKSAAILHMVQVAFLPVTQCGTFTHNTGWQFQAQGIQLKSGPLTKP